MNLCSDRSNQYTREHDLLTDALGLSPIFSLIGYAILIIISYYQLVVFLVWIIIELFLQNTYIINAFSLGSAFSCSNTSISHI